MNYPVFILHYYFLEIMQINFKNYVGLNHIFNNQHAFFKFVVYFFKFVVYEFPYNHTQDERKLSY